MELSGFTFVINVWVIGVADKVATQLIPPCAPANHYPEQTYGDGNCLFRAVSIALTGNQDLHIELRVRTFFELCLKKNDYLDDQYLKRLTGLDSCMAKLFESSFDTSSVKPGISKAVRISNAYEVDALNTIKSGSYSSMWHLYALSNVIGCPISSLYPMVEASLIDRKYMNVTITPTVQQSTSEVVILWTHTNNTNLKGWSPNHFVPLVPGTSKAAFPAAGKSSGLVQDSKSSPPPKKRQKLSDGVVKKKFTGSYMYKASFNHTWTQTWPCIVPVKNDKHSFRCILCNKVNDCGKQGIGDVKRHIQRDEHKKNAKRSKKQKTLFQACAQAQNNEDKVCT